MIVAAVVTYQVNSPLGQLTVVNSPYNMMYTAFSRPWSMLTFVDCYNSPITSGSIQKRKNWDLYKKKRNQVTNMIRKHKRSYISDHISDSKSSYASVFL